MGPVHDTGRSGLAGAAARLIDLWALLGRRVRSGTAAADARVVDLWTLIGGLVRLHFAGAAARLIDLWALLGGLVLLAVVLVNVLSVVGSVVWRPFPGDFELTEMGVAIAAFAFLPYCQLHGLNVTADIFTARAGPRWIAGFGAAGSVVAVLFAAILCWRMYAGMWDQKAYNYTTAILQVPSWWAYLPILLSLVLLGLAAVLTLGRTGRLLWRGEQAP